MHCIHKHSGDLVGAVVPALIANGYHFVRLDEIPDYNRFKGPPPELRPAIALLTLPQAQKQKARRPATGAALIRIGLSR